METISRRQLFRLAAGAAAAAWGVRGAAAEPGVRVGLVLPRAHPAAAAVRAGAELAAQEARRLAELMRTSFELATAEAADAHGAVAAARELLAGGAAVVAGGVDGGCCDALAAALPGRVLEVRARRESAPRQAPEGHLSVTPAHADWAGALARGLAKAGLRRFAMAADDPAMRRAARAAGLVESAAGEAQVVFGGRAADGRLAAGVTLAGGPGTAVPTAWHASLRRYGASELNERFEALHGRPMVGDAWSGWIAVKLAVEAALRRRPYEAVRVDGHKGVPLVFEEGRLRQPLYVVLRRGERVEVVDA